MKDLDLEVGRGVMNDLCDACRKVLEKKVTRTDILMSMTPRGFKKLVKKIEENTCQACQDKIWEAGRT